MLDDELEITERLVKKNEKKDGFKLRIKIGNESLRKLMSGAVAGAVSKTTMAPFETIKMRLTVGSSGNSMSEVFDNIMMSEGWKGLFMGNSMNVIRVAPNKAIELFACETVKRQLTPEFGEKPKLPLPPLCGFVCMKRTYMQILVVCLTYEQTFDSWCLPNIGLVNPFDDWVIGL